MKKYRIIGMNKYIPVEYFTKAKNQKDAKIHFYLEAGGNIKYIFQIK
jgi:hypothetical protein